MILAGVTGVMVGGGFSADILGIDVWFIVGAAGGGIAKSTGGRRISDDFVADNATISGSCGPEKGCRIGGT